MASVAFLRPRLCGARFEDGSIPLQVLADLAVLRELVIEVAKWRFMEANPDRQRLPRGFTKKTDLKLTGVEPGSAIPVISLAAAEPSLEGIDLPYQEYFEMARDDIVTTIASASNNGLTEGNLSLPVNLVAYFNRIGRSLRDHESMEFDVSNGSEPARLTKETRSRLLHMASVTEISQEISLRGAVPEADQDDMTFELQQVYGNKIICPLPEQHLETIIEAFSRYQNDVRIMVQGVGRFDLQNHLSSVESIDSVNLLEPLDVPARLDELRSMKDGEFEGESIAPTHEGLNWLSGIFDYYFPDDLPLPNTYPTPDGSLEMEWSEGNQTVIFEIDLSTHEGDWFQFDKQSNYEESCKVNLDTKSAWDWVSSQIRQMAAR